MKSLSELPVTELLIQWQNGNKTAYDELFTQCYQQFRHQIRKYKIQYQNRANDKESQLTICIESTTNILHHAYPRLADVTGAKLDNRADFYRLVARVVYSIMIDQYRTKTAQKNTLPTEEKEPEFDSNIAEVICDLELVDKALIKEKPRAAEILKLSIFAGLNPKRISAMYNLSLRTVQNDLKFALAWYQSHIQGS
jgi:RNA polymerase sigma factor (TIGR02999 family)